MYFWRSVFRPGYTESAFLRQQGIRTLYVKFFDIDVDPQSGKPLPVADIQQLHPPADGIQVIPVVFITQQALQAMANENPDTMAKRIATRIKQIAETAGLPTAKEWQLDCDWLAKQQGIYFPLVKALKTIAHQQHTLLSITLRLYPYKYRSVMGVPAADKALLMCYNMGNLKNPATVNSIIDPEEMEKYLTVGAPYPLPLDAALPLFSWHAWFRDKSYQGLLYPGELENLPCLDKRGHLSVFTRDTVLDGRLFLKGDVLREESADIQDLQKARHLLDTKLGGQPIGRLALFHLDSLILKKYVPDALEALLGRNP